jgi:hypothetical protein
MHSLIELSGHDTKGTGDYPLSRARLCTRGFLKQDSYELLGRPSSPLPKHNGCERENLSFIALWYGTKKKRNETKKLKGRTTTETPLSHPPTPLHTSRFHCCETRRGESRSGSRLARRPHTTARIPNSSPAPALIVVVDAAASQRVLAPGGGWPGVGVRRTGGMDPEKRGYKFRILFFVSSAFYRVYPSS